MPAPFFFADFIIGIYTYDKNRGNMKIAKKLTLIGCTLILGYTLIKWWTTPRYIEVDLPTSKPLSDGDYIIGQGGTSERILVKGGKTYAFR